LALGAMIDEVPALRCCFELRYCAPNPESEPLAPVIPELEFRYEHLLEHFKDEDRREMNDRLVSTMPFLPRVEDLWSLSASALGTRFSAGANNG
jgi:hypothetical protein